jgi:hypothetical protein
MHAIVCVIIKQTVAFIKSFDNSTNCPILVCYYRVRYWDTPIPFMNRSDITNAAESSNRRVDHEGLHLANYKQ